MPCKSCPGSNTLGSFRTLIFMAMGAKTLHKHMQNHTSGSSFLDLVLLADVCTKQHAERKAEPGGSKEMVTPHIATCTALPVRCNTRNGNSRAASQLPCPHTQHGAQAASDPGEDLFWAGYQAGVWGCSAGALEERSWCLQNAKCKSVSQTLWKCSGKSRLPFPGSLSPLG